MLDVDFVEKTMNVSGKEYHFEEIRTLKVIEKDGDFKVRIDLELGEGYEFPSSFFTLATSAS